MKERSSKERQNEDKRREGSPDRPQKKGWEGPPSDNVERRRGPGRGDEPGKRTPPNERK